MPLIFYDQINENEAKVTLVHNRPNMLSPERRAEGIEVDEVPEATRYRGQAADLYINIDTEELFYKYRDIPLSDGEKAAKSVGIVAKVTMKDAILAEELTDEEMKEIAQVYPEWEVGVAYEVDDIVSYQNKLYKVIQAHTSQADWPPDQVASLFTNIMPEGVIAEWIQPRGAHDAYSEGAQVIHNDSLWTSDINDNVWEPGVYGWTESE